MADKLIYMHIINKRNKIFTHFGSIFVGYVFTLAEKCCLHRPHTEVGRLRVRIQCSCHILYSEIPSSDQFLKET